MFRVDHRIRLPHTSHTYTHAHTHDKGTRWFSEARAKKDAKVVPVGPVCFLCGCVAFLGFQWLSVEDLKVKMDDLEKKALPSRKSSTRCALGSKSRETNSMSRGTSINALQA